MNKFKHISVGEAKELLRADNYLIDIRDKESFSISHVQGALNLSDENIDDFINNLSILKNNLSCKNES